MCIIISVINMTSILIILTIYFTLTKTRRIVSLMTYISVIALMNHLSDSSKTKLASDNFT